MLYMNRRNVAFTIVELLIVIVVIGILAAITVVAFNGIVGRTIEASMKSDLNQAAKTLGIDNTTNNGYPADANSANNGQGLKSSGDNALSYELKPYGYCISVSNPGTDTTLALRSIKGVISEGTCDVTVSTSAGSTQGYNDDTGTAAQFNYPGGVAVDNSGTIYVADTSNHRIRKITPAGVVSTLAGSTAGYLDHTTGTSARFSGPYGVAVDSSGTVYVADTNNNRIRKITPAGVVSTLAGSTAGYLDHTTGTSARFNGPRGVAVDGSGVVYVSDQNNHRIRKITPAGVVSTLAGSSQGYNDGTGAVAQFYLPDGIAVDSGGTVYVSDYANQRIRKITPTGVVTTLAGSTQGYNDGTGAVAQFDYPLGIAVDNFGTAYVVDSNNQKIRQISPAGVVTTAAGSGQGYLDGVGSSVQLNYPYGIAVDNTGTVYVADQSNNRIRKVEI